jgi:cytochrome c peroxidase
VRPALSAGLILLLAIPCAAADPAAVAYDWKLPPGFPTPLVPHDNPMSFAKVELGARLFAEKRLSITGNYACDSCHQPRLAYTDGRPKALGATGAPTRHSAMSLANVAYDAALTWSDSSVRTLERQMSQPLFNQHPVEMGLGGRESQVLALLAADAGYRAQFTAAFPGASVPISINHLIKAIAAFERTLISGRSPFDRYVFNDDENALSSSAKRGMALFYSARAGCSQCHSGLNFSGPLRYRGHGQATASMANSGLGKMRVPTLRNVALTAPYMHDGSIATLNEVIDHYIAGGGRSADRRIHPLTLSEQDKQELIAFLESLTDPEFVAGGDRAIAAAENPQCEVAAPPVASISSLPRLPLWTLLVSIKSKTLLW